MLSISVSHGLGLYLLGAYSLVDHREAHLNPSQKAVRREAVRQAIGVINYSRWKLAWALGMWQGREGEVPALLGQRWYGGQGAQEAGSSVSTRGA